MNEPTSSNTPWIQTEQLSRFYKRGRHEVRALDTVSLAIEAKEFLAVVGSSGSGKSTLINLLAGLDTPTAGHIVVDGQRLDQLSAKALASYRARTVGIVFQSFNLLLQHTALRNVEMALFFDDTPARERRDKAAEALERLGLGERLHHRPLDLSGGEQQRVAIARAFVKRPRILFADEPTGNLDRTNSEAIMNILTDLNRAGTAIVMVTHDVEMAERTAERVLHMEYGRLYDTGQ
jgi:putative ABC transport system ATP-binding protein